MFENKCLKKLKPYSLVSQKVFELENFNDVTKLDWNEATINPSPKVFSALKKYLDNGKFNWYPPLHNQKLLTLLSKYCKINQKYLQYYPSSDSIHEYIARAFISSGDKVLIISPTYDNFRVTIQSFGAQINYFRLAENFSFKENKFIQNMKKIKPKLVYLCNPNNPTGTTYSMVQIEKLIKMFKNTMFLIDEAYFEFEGNSSKDLVKTHKNILVTRTFSKAFALAGFRIGYLISHPDNLKILNKIRNPKNVTAMTQEAAIAALQDISYMKKYVKEVKNAKKTFCKSLDKLNIKYYSGGGNFILIDLKRNKINIIKLLSNKNIFVRNYDLKLKNYIRITIGTEKDMKKVLDIFNGLEYE